MDARAKFPLTLRHLGDALPAAQSADALVTAVCAAHAKGDIPSRAVRDLVRYEALLLDLPPGPPPPRAPPPEAPCVLAPHVRVLVFGGDLPAMRDALREGRPARPRPARGWLVLWRDAKGDAHELLLPREEGWFIERFRAPALPADAIEDDEERALFERLWREAVLVRHEA